MNREILQTKLNSQVQYKTTTVTFDDVWSKYESNIGKKNKFRNTSIGLAAALILLIATPVGASVYFKWHNIEIKPELPETKLPLAKFESYPMMVKLHKNFDLTETQKLSSYKIMRPTYKLNMPLEVSRGTMVYPPSLPLKKFKGPITYYDIWHQEDKWVYTIQLLDEEVTRELKNGTTMKDNFKIPMNDKVIPLKNKDGIAILQDQGKNGKRIRMYIRNKENQVIYFEIRGNVNDDELIKLAESYTEF